MLSSTSVAELPSPFHLFRCPYEKRLGELDDLDERARRQAWERFAERLTAAELAACSYHQADWRKVAALSLAVLDRIQSGQSRRRAVRVIADRFKLGSEDRWALSSLFSDPIIWHFGSSEIISGQHRICALKVAHAYRCVVER